MIFSLNDFFLVCQNSSQKEIRVFTKLNLQEVKAPRVRGLSAEENLVLT